MKTIKILLLALFLVVLPAVVQAQFTFATNGDNTITITGYTGYGGTVTIPSTTNGLPVTSIGDSAFEYKSVTSVMIPDSVNKIGSYAFYDCTSLTNVIIGTNTTSIGWYAFESCFSLTNVMIPNSVTNIGSGAFNYCIGLKAITVDTNNPVYSSVAGVVFNTNQAILILCPDGKAGGYTIPDNVISIGVSAFYSCTNLTSITIPDSVTNIGEGAFTYCSSLTNITIPNSCNINSIGYDVFNGCTSLMSVTIPNSVTSIEDSAFYFCTSLTSVTIPNSVTNIGSEVFLYCSNLTSVTIPDGVINIGSEAFAYCFSLTAITVDALNPAYSSVDGVLFNQNQTTLIQYPGGKTGNYTVPNSVTSIETNAFMGCATITNVTFGNSVTNIGSQAFESCPNLSSVIIPNSVVSIGLAAFESCPSLTNVTIGNSVTHIESFAFFGCPSLTAITVDALNPAYSSAAGVLFNINQTTLIQYPGGITGSYTIPNNVASIGSYAFGRCHLASVKISDSVTNIGSDAFFACTSLTNVTFGNGVTRIGNDAFEGCGLTHITIPDSVTSIGNEAFAFCMSLTNVTIGNSVTIIGSDAFTGLLNLKAALFKGNAPTADSSVFSGDLNVTIYYLPGTTGWGTTFGGRPTALWNPHAATIRYVNVNGTAPTSPYTNWATAAATIQDAVDVALDGDQILVINGIYQAGGRATSGSLTNRVAVTKAVTVSSVDGPAVTLIKGYQVPGITNGVGAIRCVYLTNGAVLLGFTLTNGATSGNGGGLYCESINAFASNCVVAGNSSASVGGGTYQGTLNNCIVSGNTAFIGGGAAYSTLNNCVLVSNSASFVGGGAENGILNNCTIVGNWALSGGSGTDYSYLNNSIVYYNQGSEEAYNSFSTNCCISNWRFFGIINSFSNAPVFVDLAGGNLRLQSNSPCINAGINTSVTSPTDLDGNPRVQGGTVDVGAYEFQTPGSVISYQWLQQFGLPTDGSADFVDSDGDGLNNWQEWRARTDPNDASSVLKLAPPVFYPWGVRVWWLSPGGVAYFIQRSTNLLATPAFTTIQTNIVGQSGWAGYDDYDKVQPAGGGSVFYRVGVQ